MGHLAVQRNAAGLPGEKVLKKCFQGSELAKGSQSLGEPKKPNLVGPGTETLAMHREVQAGGCGRDGCSWASPSAGMSPFKFPVGTNRQSQGLSSCRPSSPSPLRGPQAIPVPCRDPPAVQPGLATYREDRDEPARTYLLGRADLGVHRRILCSGLCKDKKVEGQRGSRLPRPGRGCGGSPCMTHGAAGMLLAKGWRECWLKLCQAQAKTRPCRS